MYVVETTWQGKRHSHSWLTCVSQSMLVAQEQCARIQEPNASHRTYEVSEKAFPVFFVVRERDYECMSRLQVQELLASVIPTESNDSVLFNVYIFTGEYLWGAEGRGNTERHFHVTGDSLSHYRSGEGSLWENIAHAPDA